MSLAQNVHKLVAASSVAPTEVPESNWPRPADASFSPRRLIDLCLRRRMTVLKVLLAGLGMAAAYLLTTAPLYKASVRLLVENQTPRISSAQSMNTDGGSHELAVLSQVEVLRSPRLIERVILAAGLAGAAGVNTGDRPSQEAPADQTTAKTVQLPTGLVESLARRLTVSRVGPTSLIQIDYFHQNPEIAAKTINLLANTYLEMQVEAKNHSTKRASEWLNTRVADLREQIHKNEQRIQRFKSENNLFRVGQMTVDERVLSSTAEQLSAARATEAAAAARLKQIEQLSSDPDQLMSLGKALQSDTIREYRRQYAEVARKRASVISRFGNQHPEVANADAELKDLDKQIAKEVARIVDSAKSDFELANMQVNQLEGKLGQLNRQLYEHSQLAIELLDMERQNQSAGALYATLLARQQELDSLETLNGPDARIVSLAPTPTSPSHPRRTLVLGLALVTSVLVALGLALVLEYIFPTFTAPEDVERVLGMTCITSVPKYREPTEPARQTRASWIATFSPEPAVSGLRELLARSHRFVRSGLSGELRATHQSSEEHAETTNPTLLRPVLSSTINSFTESIFPVHNAIHDFISRSDGGVIAIASPESGNGKTTLAVAVADYFASCDRKVLLLDADLRDSSLTRVLSPNSALSFVDVLEGRARFSDVAVTDASSTIRFCPAPLELKGKRPMDLLASKGMADFIAAARREFDLVVIDTTAIGRAVDARPLLKASDAVLLIVEYGVSQTDRTYSALRDTGVPAAKLLGSIINKRPNGSHG